MWHCFLFIHIYNCPLRCPLCRLPLGRLRRRRRWIASSTLVRRRQIAPFAAGLGPKWIVANWRLSRWVKVVKSSLISNASSIPRICIKKRTRLGIPSWSTRNSPGSRISNAAPAKRSKRKSWKALDRDAPLPGGYVRVNEWNGLKRGWRKCHMKLIWRRCS